MGFLQLVANQVAVAVENALAFQEIEAAFREIQALKDKLAQENAYLEEEVRTEHNFGEIVGESATLRRVLKQVETVEPRLIVYLNRLADLLFVMARWCNHRANVAETEWSGS